MNSDSPFGLTKEQAEARLVDLENASSKDYVLCPCSACSHPRNGPLLLRKNWITRRGVVFKHLTGDAHQHKKDLARTESPWLTAAHAKRAFLQDGDYDVNGNPLRPGVSSLLPSAG